MAQPGKQHTRWRTAMWLWNIGAALGRPVLAVALAIIAGAIVILITWPDKTIDSFSNIFTAYSTPFSGSFGNPISFSNTLVRVSPGRGFIALAAVNFGKYTPLGAAVACAILGLGGALSYALQGLSTSANLSNLLNTLPYILTLIALVGMVGRTTPPAADGIPYEPGSD